MSSISALPIGALTLDAGLSIRSVDPVFLDLLGYKDAELIGRSFEGLVLSHHGDALTRLLESVEQDGLQLDLRFISAHGGSLGASVTFVKLTEKGRAHAGLLDVILRRIDHEYLLQQALRIDDALALTRIANWELEIATGRIFASHSWSRLWGLTADEATRLEAVLDRVHPQDRALVESALRDAAKSSACIHVRFRILRPDGTLRWVEGTGRLSSVGSGESGRLCGAVLDISDQHNSEQALERCADIVSATTDRIAFIDGECRVLAANTAFLRALGRERADIIDQPLAHVCGESELSARVQANLACCFEENRGVVEDIREIADNGETRNVEMRLFPHCNGQGTVTGIVISMRDVTATRDAERRLLQSAAVYGATSDGVLITDASGIVVSVNTAFTRITGYAESELLGHNPSLLSSHWHTRGFFVGMWRQLLRRGSWQGEIWNRRKDGEVYRQRLTIRRVLDSSGKLVNFVGIFAERTHASQPTEHMLHYDALTKLPNRLLFESRLEHALERAIRKTDPIALFILDLDHFAHINTSLGHQIGDDVLRATALRLREAIRPADTLARLRADQFGLLFEEIGHIDEVSEIAQRLRESLRAPIWARNHLLHVTISIGIALKSKPGDNQGLLLGNAESALRQVKQQGRDAFLISTAEPDAAQQAHRRRAGLLRTALEEGDFKLLYRPGMAMTTNVCDYVEACIHWDHPEFGPMPSERLHTLANESGLMAEIGNWILERACGQFQTWLGKGLPLPCSAVNICERQLTQGDLVRRLARLLEAYPLVAPHLALEFSESLLVKHREQMAEIIQGVNQLGVGIVLSDVGLGWTAPAVLQRLPIKSLKIHARFIEGLPGSPHELAVVEALIAMAQSLRLEIRADGVRTKEQQYQLMDLGCSGAQGELFSAPLNAAQFETWIQPWQQPPSQPPTLRTS